MLTREFCTVAALDHWRRLADVTFSPTAEANIRLLCNGDAYLKYESA